MQLESENATERFSDDRRKLTWRAGVVTDLMTYGVANIQLNHPLNLSGCARPKLCTGFCQQLSFAFHLTSLLPSGSYFLLPTTGLLILLRDAMTYIDISNISTVRPLINIVAKSNTLFFFTSSHGFLLVGLYSYLSCKR